MNIHVPQQYDARAELDILSSTKSNIMSSQSSKSNISIVQDSLLGAYLMCKREDIIPKHIFNNILMKGDGWDMNFIDNKIKHIKEVLEELGKDESILYTGKGLISFMLPDDFFYVKKTNANTKEPFVRIFKGVLYEGAFNKSILGSSHNSIIQTLHKEYNQDICMNFVNNIQFITNEWLCHYSFSVGIGDCIAKKETENTINETIVKCFIEAKQIEEATQHPKIKEARINGALSKAKDIGMKIAKDSLHENNGFVSSVTSGAKGDFFNIAQISGLVGQQNISGNRITPVLNRGRRTLPHYAFENLSMEDEFESRGFIKNSFLKGLTPQEFWFHAMSGREGVSDTALKTAQSGYIQRKMVKVMEDVQVRYDGTVRNSSGSIIQWVYGDDGMDRANTIVLNDKSEVLDIARVADKLNAMYESDISKIKMKFKNLKL
jgi:DNA-directed RNA polymerase II subunit RPB1